MTGLCPRRQRPRDQGEFLRLSLARQHQIAADLIFHTFLSKVPRPANSYKALFSVDGGGLRGCVPATASVFIAHAIKEVILEQRSRWPGLIPDSITSAKQFDIDLVDYFDGFFGTSIGTVISSLLATRGADMATALPELSRLGIRPGSAPSLMIMMLGLGNASVQAPPVSFANNATYWTTAGAQTANAATFFQNLYGPNRLLSSCEKDCYFVATNLQDANAIGFWKSKETSWVGTDIPPVESLYFGADGTGKPRFSERITGLGQDYAGREFLLWNVVRSSSAVPTLALPFEITTVPPTKPIDAFNAVLVDGVVNSNNPTSLGLAWTLRTNSDLPANKIAILSLGTTRSGPNFTSMGEYINAIQNPGFIWSQSALNSNPAGELPQVLLNRDSDASLGDSSIPGRYLRINRNFLPATAQSIQDPEKQKKYWRQWSATYYGNDLPTLFETGAELGNEYYETVKEWARYYLFGVAA